EPALGRWLADAEPFATVGPMAPATIDDRPVTGPTANLRVTAAYRGGLAGHVEVLAGELPPDGLGGGATAMTMPQDGADRLGLRLSDRFCADLSPPDPAGEARWCGRIVGLWRPLRGGDPYWGGTPPS